MTNIAFQNDPALAAQVRAQIDAHTRADEVIQGQYWENGKGCFIGCIAHGSDVQVVEQLTGFPVMLTRIAESIFEGLPNDKAKLFPQQIIQAVPVGADLSLVAWKFLHWVVSDALETHGTADVRNGCSAALAVLAAKARGENVSANAAYAAYAAAYAAYAAAYAAAHAAAYAAAHAADAAADAAYAAYAAAHAADAAAHAADAAARIRQAEKLVALLGETA